MASVSTNGAKGKVLPDLSAKAKVEAAPSHGLNTRGDFSMSNAVRVGGSNREPIYAYDNVTTKGSAYFHIRKIYQDDNDEWCPGKGISVPADQKATLLAALASMVATS